MTAWIALGSNLPGPAGEPPQMLLWAVARLRAHGVGVTAVSRFYRSAPVPAADQPDYVNAVCAVAGRPDPDALLAVLHGIEAEAGRIRTVRNASRVLDLDLLAIDELARAETDSPGGPILPHPRLHERAFVLLPLRDVAPGWRHPTLGTDIATLLAALPADQPIAPMAEDDAGPLG